MNKKDWERSKNPESRLLSLIWKNTSDPTTMWYLSRAPHTRIDPKPSDDLSTFISRNSIFPASDTGVFEEIFIVHVPKNNPKTSNNSNNRTTTTITDDDDDTLACAVGSNGCSSWEWFAYLSSLTQFSAVAVPRNYPNPTSTTLQMIAVSPESFLCATKLYEPYPHGVLCMYSRTDNSWKDIPKLNRAERNLIGSVGAILGDWLYLAGGFEGNPIYVEASSYLNSAERLNLKTWEWQSLPLMHKTRAYAVGLAYGGRFYVVGGEVDKYSADVYNPTSNTWQYIKSFVPNEADGFTMTSMCGHLMLLLTWSCRLGVKLWAMVEAGNVGMNWVCVSYFPDSSLQMVQMMQHGARMVTVGNEVWVLLGEIGCICQVDGPFVWPVFPAPDFRPNSRHDVKRNGHIHAFSFQVNGRISWRQIPVYTFSDSWVPSFGNMGFGF